MEKKLREEDERVVYGLDPGRVEDPPIDHVPRPSDYDGPRVGPTSMTASAKSLADYFLLIWLEGDLETWARMSTCYAKEEPVKYRGASARQGYIPWFPADGEECKRTRLGNAVWHGISSGSLLVFFGILIRFATLHNHLYEHFRCFIVTLYEFKLQSVHTPANL